MPKTNVANVVSPQQVKNRQKKGEYPMKRMAGLGLMFPGVAIGLASLYAGISIVLSQIIYGGAENILVDVFFILLGAGFLFFALRWGVSHEKRTLAVFFFIGSVIFLALSIQLFVTFAGSLPSPSEGWLQSMAMSRAHALGEFPVIDHKLITQGRIATSGMAIVSLIFSIMLAWFGKNWLKNQTHPESEPAP